MLGGATLTLPILALVTAFIPVLGAIISAIVTAVAGFGSFVLIVLWAIVCFLLTLIPYVIASGFALGPEGDRAGLIEEPAVCYVMRGGMTGFSLGANIALLAGLIPVSVGFALIPIIIGVVTHVLSLIPSLSRDPWVKMVFGWSGWFMPFTWLAQLVGVIYVGLTFLGTLFGANFRWEFDWQHGVISFIGGWGGSLQFQARAFAPGNFVFVDAPADVEPSPITSPRHSILATLKHEIGHSLHTSVLGSFFLALDGLDTQFFSARGQLAYGELLASGHSRQSPVYWMESSSQTPTWMGMFGLAPNRIPTVTMLMAPRSGTVGTGLVYTASSSDPDMFLPPPGFQWTVLRGDGTPAPELLTNATTSSMTFTPDTPGLYTISVYSHDAMASSFPEQVCVGVDVPTADITGPDPNDIEPGDTLLLDGSGSSDPAGGIIDAYNWDLVLVPEGSRAVMTINAADGSAIQFTPDLPGRYIASLVVINDSDIESCPMHFPMQVQCTPAASLPIATVAALAPVNVGTSVTFDASSSVSPDGSPLSFDWTIIESPPGSEENLSANNVAMPAFIPDMAGRYLFRLVVGNASGVGCPAFATLEVPDPLPLTVERADTGLVISSAASTSTPGPLSLVAGPLADALGNPINLDWAVTAIPGGSTLSGPGLTGTGPLFSFQPDVGGPYSVTVTATDSGGSILTRSSWCEDVRFTTPQQILTSTNLLGNASRQSLPGEPDYLEIFVGARATINADAVNRVNGLPNTFVWRFEQKPPASNAVLQAPSLAHGKGIQFDADVPGRYVVSVKIGNTNGFTCPELHIIDVVDK